jgi:hypothetical protein
MNAATTTAVNPFEALTKAALAKAAAKPAAKKPTRGPVAKFIGADPAPQTAKAPVAKKAVESAVKAKPAAEAAVNPAANAPEVKVTKKAQAVMFYKKNIKKGKGAVITFFKGDLSMSDAGANSYFYAIKKQLATAAE